MSDEPTSDLWPIGLASWIIQDRNYTDFHVGQEVEFAVEFYTETGLRHTDDRGRFARPFPERSDTAYNIRGQVTMVAPPDRNQSGAWVVDFGLIACAEGQQPPADMHVSDWVEGTVLLTVDHFDIRDLTELPGFPPLIYTWQVEAIDEWTGPYVLDATGTWVPEMTQWESRSVEKTAAKASIDPPDYTLHCRRLDVPLKRLSESAYADS